MSASVAETAAAPTVGLAAGRGVWVVLPTYNERENLEPIAAAILAALPEGSLLVVDDRSPDGTGELADTIAAREARVSVLHRPGKQGLGAAYRDGFRWVLERPETRAVVQMDADFSHDPATLPRMLAPLMGNADLVLGTRYMKGGSTVGWPWYRKLISRGGTIFARTVLMLPYRDLTGGFKAWRRELIDAIRLRETSGSGYGFQIETTWCEHRPGPDHVPGARGRLVEDERRHRPRGHAARPSAALERDPRRTPCRPVTPAASMNRAVCT